MEVFFGTAAPTNTNPNNAPEGALYFRNPNFRKTGGGQTQACTLYEKNSSGWTEFISFSCTA